MSERPQDNSVWQHRGTNKLYVVRSVSKFSDDGRHDGKEIVEYAERFTKEKYSTPLARFYQKFRSWNAIAEPETTSGIR